MKKLVLLAFCLCSAVVFAQDEVSLVVSADGTTKTQAIDNALRLAIEQTYGTFVSANTQILNDQLVKDEIATVSSGNIQKYKEVACVALPNGNTSVTLNVTVSLKKLVKYAQSKGSECEFAGATFGANKRMYDFNKRNEEIAIDNLIKQLEGLRPVYDYEMEVSEPTIGKGGETGIIKLQVTVKSNDKTKSFNELIENTIMSLAMTAKQIKPMADAGFTFMPYVLLLDGKINKFHLSQNGMYCYPKENQIYYFYSNALIKLDWVLSDAMYDFQIKDNNGNEFLLIDFYRNLYERLDPFLTYSIGHRFLTFGNEALWGYQYGKIERRNGEKESPRINTQIHTKFDRTIPHVAGIFALNKTNVLMIIPDMDMSFTVPIESINTISKISISPSFQERTCFLVDMGSKPHVLGELRKMKYDLGGSNEGNLLLCTLFCLKDGTDELKWLKSLRMTTPPTEKPERRARR